jgi:hypothetical protein
MSSARWSISPAPSAEAVPPSWLGRRRDSARAPPCGRVDRATVSAEGRRRQPRRLKTAAGCAGTTTMAGTGRRLPARIAVAPSPPHRTRLHHRHPRHPGHPARPSPGHRRGRPRRPTTDRPAGRRGPRAPPCPTTRRRSAPPVWWGAGPGRRGRAAGTGRRTPSEIPRHRRGRTRPRPGGPYGMSGRTSSVARRTPRRSGDRNGRRGRAWCRTVCKA